MSRKKREKSNGKSEKIMLDQNYHLHKHHEIFMDLARLYEEKHYQSFVALGLLQLEGLFFDICSIRYDDKKMLVH
ncbi:MAG: hypothetical protein V8R00_02030 [Coprococcus catus]